MNAPRFRHGQWCRDFITGIPVQVLEPLKECHRLTGERLYLVESRAGRRRRIQERNLKPTTH